MSTDYVPTGFDGLALLIAHVLLFIVLVLAIVRRVGATIVRRRGASHLEVSRGDRSMGALYVTYGVTTLVFSLIVQVSEYGRGYKSGIILADYVAWSYLFFFNPWFRNRVFQLYDRASKD